MSSEKNTLDPFEVEGLIDDYPRLNSAFFYLRKL